MLFRSVMFHLQSQTDQFAAFWEEAGGPLIGELVDGGREQVESAVEGFMAARCSTPQTGEGTPTNRPYPATCAAVRNSIGIADRSRPTKIIKALTTAWIILDPGVVRCGGAPRPAAAHRVNAGSTGAASTHTGPVPDRIAPPSWCIVTSGWHPCPRAAQ